MVYSNSDSDENEKKVHKIKSIPEGIWVRGSILLCYYCYVKGTAYQVLTTFKVVDYHNGDGWLWRCCPENVFWETNRSMLCNYGHFVNVLSRYSRKRKYVLTIKFSTCLCVTFQLSIQLGKV